MANRLFPVDQPRIVGESFVSDWEAICQYCNSVLSQPQVEIIFLGVRSMGVSFANQYFMYNQDVFTLVDPVVCYQCGNPIRNIYSNRGTLATLTFPLSICVN